MTTARGEWYFTSMAHSDSRRRFLKWMGAGTAAAALSTVFPFLSRSRQQVWASPRNHSNGSTEDTIEPGLPRRALGRTGVQTGLFSLGGEATVQTASRRETAEEILNRAIDLGVNYIDTSPRYGNGGSETNIGHVMRDRRGEVFLATKTHDRSYDGTMRLVEQSLKRLQTDHLDLYQLHNVRVHNDLDRAFADDGAIHALERLKREKVVGNIGITGHRDPTVLLRGIREHSFDTILMSLNAADRYYEPFQEELLETAVEQQLGIIAMKVAAVGRVFREDGITSMEQALGYVLSLPVSTAIIGISTVKELEENVRIAQRFEPYSREQMREVEQLVSHYETEANFFKHHW